MMIEDDDEMREDKKTQKITKKKDENTPKIDFPDKKKINTYEHYSRYCKKKESIHNSLLTKTICI